MALKRSLKAIRDYIRFIINCDKWEKLNAHNYTVMGNNFPIDRVSVGKYTYGKLNVHYYKQPEEKLVIGNYCSIAENVHFFLGGEHGYKQLTTYPFKNIITKNQIAESITKGPIILGDDVWIGVGCTILSGVTIGQGAIIGAGSVVAKDVDPYAIYAGNKIVKYRFSDSIIKRLLDIDYSKLSFDIAEQNLNLLYELVTEDNIEAIINRIGVSNE